MLGLLFLFAELKLHRLPPPDGIDAFGLCRYSPVLEALGRASSNDVILSRRTMVLLDFLIDTFESIAW